MTSNITNRNPHIYEFLTNQINPKGIIHISHGMAEHIPRYKWLIGKFNDDGYHVIANDHKGHGLSVNDNESFGYFTNTNGWNEVVGDLESLINNTKIKYPDLDQFLIGHSMGSWIALSAMTRGLDIKGLILSGSSKVPTITVYIQKILTNIQILFFGKKSISNFLDGLTIKGYNKSFSPNRTQSDWITSDENNVDEYILDPLCGFKVTNLLWRDLADGLISISKKKAFNSACQNTPVFIISGDMDPVGESGKGVKRLFDYLVTIFPNTSMNLVKNARHEVFSETNKDHSYDKVKQFIELS